MAALNTDKFKKGARKWTGQIGSGSVADASTTTVPLSSVTNLPTDTAIDAVINRVDANGTATPTAEETVTGVVSGTNLVTCTRGVEGTAQAHAAGSVVEILLTSNMWDDFVDGILVQHNQLGLHTDITASDVTASGTVSTDVVAEKTAATGVTVDGVLLKDGEVTTDVVNEKTAAAGVTIDGLLIKDGRVAGWDAWMPAEQTWTYASATTITIPAGGAAKYAKGDKIKLTQTTVKYFSIVGVADTVLTITAGTSYTLVDAAISANYYSKVENPQGFPDWFDWTPTWTGRGSLTTTSVTNHLARFRISGKTLTCQLKTNLTTGGTTDIQIYFTAPVNLLQATANWQTFHGWAYTGGITWIALGSMNVDATHIALFRYDGANWGLAAISVGASGSYEI